MHLALILVAIYIFLKLASPALTSFDAFLPGGSTVDAFPFIGLLTLVLFFSDIYFPNLQVGIAIIDG